jgi:two-component system OmpR family response regulator
MRILLVGHKREVGLRLASELEANDHQSILVDTGEQATNALEATAFDMVLLHRAMPNTPGWQTLAQLYACEHPAIVILPAGERDGASALPHMLRKRQDTHRPHNEDLLTAEDLIMNVRSHEVWRADRAITLTDKEFRLLRLLLEQRGQVVHRETLLAQVWGYDFDPHTNVIEVHMSRLRGKIEHPLQTKLLKTIRAVGYLIR